jgi:hypothetical protein
MSQSIVRDSTVPSACAQLHMFVMLPYVGYQETQRTQDLLTTVTRRQDSSLKNVATDCLILQLSRTLLLLQWLNINGITSHASAGRRMTSRLRPANWLRQIMTGIRLQQQSAVSVTQWTSGVVTCFICVLIRKRCRLFSYMWTSR